MFTLQEIVLLYVQDHTSTCDKLQIVWIHNFINVCCSGRSPWTQPLRPCSSHGERCICFRTHVDRCQAARSNEDQPAQPLTSKKRAKKDEVEIGWMCVECGWPWGYRHIHKATNPRSLVRRADSGSGLYQIQWFRWRRLGMQYVQ